MLIQEQQVCKYCNLIKSIEHLHYYDDNYYDYYDCYGDFYDYFDVSLNICMIKKFFFFFCVHIKCI